MVFLDATFECSISDTLIFMEIKGAKVVYISCKFHLHLTNERFKSRVVEDVKGVQMIIINLKSIYIGPNDPK